MSHHHPAHHQAPVSITSARVSRSVDLRRREVRYLISMGIRTVCFVLAVVTDGPLRWALVVAAIFLPYVAVILANTQDRRAEQAGPDTFTPEPLPQIESGPTRPPSDQV